MPNRWQRCVPEERRHLHRRATPSVSLPANPNSTSCLANNPLYSGTSGLSQVSNCSNCYYGDTGNPGDEGDAFVGDATTGSGGFTGDLTIGSQQRCHHPVAHHLPRLHLGVWYGVRESMCNYNDATTTTPNDVLGLIANNFVEINRPVYNNQEATTRETRCLLFATGRRGSPPSATHQPARAAPPVPRKGLTVDATVLALNQSFVVNNYGDSPGEGGRSSTARSNRTPEARLVWSAATTATTSTTR